MNYNNNYNNVDLAVERELWEMNSVKVVPVVIGAPGTTVEPRLMATSVIRPPCYFGLFFFWPGKTALHSLIENPG